MAKRSGSAKSCGGKKVEVECTPVCGVSDISADAHATVHGIVVSVSLKRKGGHFEGELSDGVAIGRVVVVLRNCQTQLSTYSNRMEVLLKSFPKIEESKAEMDIKDIATVGADVICLKNCKIRKIATELLCR